MKWPSLFEHDHHHDHDPPPPPHHHHHQQQQHENEPPPRHRDRLWKFWLKQFYGRLLLALYLLSGVYFVAPEQQAVVTRFGRVVAQGITPGIHYSLPWPIERVEKLKVLETKRLTVGFEALDQALGRAMVAHPAQYLTGDQNLITVQLAAQYAINDPAAYLYRARDLTQMIAVAIESAFAQTIAAESVDNVLTTGKIAVQNATLVRARVILDDYASGVHLNSISLESITPPVEVADAFRDVASARADRDRIINEAQGYASDTTAKAQGEADKLRAEAESFRQQRINEATGEAARFEKLWAEAGRAKALTEQRLYLETMEEVLPRVKKVVVDSRGPKSLMDLGVIRPSP